MAYTAHNPTTIYADIVARLTSQTGKAVGESEAPAGAVQNASLEPYVIVYPQLELFEGSLSDPNIIDEFTFQLTCVGGTMAHAQWMQHSARAAVLGWAPTVAGFTPTPIRLVLGSGIARDDDVQPPVFYSTDRFECFTS